MLLDSLKDIDDLVIFQGHILIPSPIHQLGKMSLGENY